MEIDITEFYNNADTRKYSNSVCNSGMANIGEITWRNAKKCKTSISMTWEESRAFMRYLEDCGMENTSKHNANEARSLLIQYISSEIQERQMFDSWAEYQKTSENDQVSGSLFEANGNIYIQLDTPMYE